MYKPTKDQIALSELLTESGIENKIEGDIPHILIPGEFCTMMINQDHQTWFEENWVTLEAGKIFNSIKDAGFSFKKTGEKDEDGQLIWRLEI